MSEEILRLQEVLEQDPSNHEAFEQLGALYRQGLEWRSLVSLYEGFEPTNGVADDPSALFSGLVRGLRDISMDLSDKREKGALLVALGDVYIKIDMREDAMTAYQESFKAYPKDTTCLRRARTIYMESEDYERVIVLYELEAKVLKKVKKREQLANAYLEMGELYGKYLNNTPKALEMVLSAQETYPEIQGVEEHLVRYSGSDEIAQRVNMLVEQALDLEDVNPRSAARMLVSAARLEHARQGGDLGDAHEYLERAISLDDDNQDAKSTLDQILEALRGDTSAEGESDGEGEGEGAVAVVGAVMLNEDDLTEYDEDPVPQHISEASSEEEHPEDLSEGRDQDFSEEEQDEYELEEVPSGIEEDSEEDVPTQVIEAYDLAPTDDSSISEVEGPGESAASEFSDPKATMMLSPEDLAAVRAADEAAHSEAVSDSDVSEGAHQELAAEVTDELEDESASSAAEDVFEEDDDPVAQAPAEDAVEELVEDESAPDEAPEEVVEEEHPEDLSEGKDQDFSEGRYQASPVPEPVGEALDDAALEEAKKALKKDAGNLALLSPVQSELIRRQEWRELTDVLEKSVKRLRKKDGEYDVMRTLAYVAWRELDDTKLAENYYKRLRRQDEVEAPEVDDFYEEYYAERGDWRKLHAQLNSKLQETQGVEPRRQLVTRLAEIAENQMSSPEKAIDSWRGFLEDAPGDEQGKAELRRLYEQHEKWTALISYLQDELKLIEDSEQADERVPERIALLEEIATIYRDRIPRGDINQINALQSLLELDPTHRDAFDALRGLLDGNRRFSELATLLSEQADAAVAEGDHARAVELLVEVADLWEVRLKNVTHALPFLQRILELDPEQAEVRERLKKIYRDRRDYAALFDLLSAETPSVPGDALGDHLQELLSLAQERLRDPEKAVPILRQLIELDASDVDLYDKLEYIYKRQEDWAAQAELLERKSELGLDERATVDALRHAADLYEEKLEDGERAAGLWARVLDIDEQNGQAFDRLTDLYVKAKRFDDLEELYARRENLERVYGILGSVAASTQDADEQRAILRRMASLAEDRLQDAGKVIESLEFLLEIAEAPDQVARELIVWYQETQDLAAQVRMHELLLEHTTEPAERFGQLARLSELEQEQGDVPAALRWQLQAVAALPGEESAVARAEQLAREHGDLALFLEHLDAIAEQRAEEPELQAALWERIARLSRDELEDNARAITLYERLHEHDAHDVSFMAALDHLYDIGAYPEKRIAILRTWYAKLDADAAPADELVEQLGKIADVQHRRLSDVEAALATYQQILELDPDHLGTLRGLREIYAGEERWDDVIEMLEREYELVGLDDAERRLEVRMQLGSTWKIFKEDPARALEQYGMVLEEQPDHEPALEQVEQLLDLPEVARDGALMLEPLFRSSAEHSRLAAALVARLGVTADEFEEREILEELVPLYTDVLQDIEAAFPHAARRFELDADNEALWHQLKDLGGQLDRWVDVEELFARFSPVGEGVDDHRHRFELLRHLADVREVYLGDKEGALAAWAQLMEFEPTDLEVIEHVESLYRELMRHNELVATLVAKAEVVTDPEQRVAISMEAANLTDSVLDDLPGAIELYRGVLDVEPDHEPAVEALERLYSAQQLWMDLDDLYTQQADLSEPERRRELLLKQAKRRTHELEDASGAFGILQQLVMQDGEDHDAVAALVKLDEVLAERDAEALLRLDMAQELERLYREREDFPRLIGVLRIKLQFIDEVYERIALLDELSALYLDHVGDGPSAFDATRQAVVLMPEEVERRERLEILAERLERFDDVVMAYEEAAEDADPYVAAPLHKRRGQLLDVELEMLAEAIDAYEAALQIMDDDMEVLQALEKLYARTQDFERLSENLSAQARFADPDVRMMLLDRIGDLEEQLLKRPDRAIDAYNELLSADPTSMVAMGALQNLYTNEERWAELADVLERMANTLESDSERLDTLASLAVVQEDRLEDVDRAIDVYTDMRAIDPANESALNALDRLYAQEARAADLADILRVKLELVDDEGDQTELQLRLAVVLAEDLLSIDDALDLYLDVFERRPGNQPSLEAMVRYAEDISYSERISPVLVDFYSTTGAWNELIELYRVRRDMFSDPEEQAEFSARIALIYQDRLRQFDDAIEAMADAWKRAPQRDEYREVLTDIVERQGAWATLAGVYEDVLPEVYDPERVKDLRVRLAEIYRDQLDQTIEAEENFREALRQDEQDASIFDQLELLLTGQERWVDLVELLEQRYLAFASEPDARYILLKIARTQDELIDDKFIAVDAYLRVLDVDPENQDAAGALDRLYRTQGRWEDLSDFLDRLIGQSYEDTGRMIELKLAQADVQRVNLVDPHRALQLYREILMDAPGHADTVQALEEMFAEEEDLRLMIAEELEPIYRSGESWTKLITVLRAKAEAEYDPLTRAELLGECAKVAERDKRDFSEALSTTIEVFEITPESDEVRQGLDRLALRLNAWPQVVGAYERTLEDNMDIGDMLRVTLLMELGAILEERLEELERARDVVRRVFDQEPDHDGAFDAVERLNARLDDWDAMVALYERRVEAKFDPEEQAILLDRLADLQEDHMQDEAAAIATLERLLEIVPDDLQAQRSLQRLLAATGRFEDLADLFRRLADQTFEPERALTLKFRLAQLLESELDRIDDAIELHRDILMQQPGWRDSLSSLEGLRRDLGARDGDWGMQIAGIIDLLLEHYDVTQDWRRIVELYVSKADVMDVAEERFAYLVRAGELIESSASELAEKQEALSLYAEAYAASPANPEAFMRIEALTEQLGSWEQLIPMLLSPLEQAEEPETQGMILNAVAQVYQERLQDSESALLAYEQGLQLDPTNQQAGERLESLYEEFEHWAPLADLLAMRLEDTFDGVVRADMLRRVAHLYDGRLGRNEDAINAYEELRELEPGERAHLDALARLYMDTERHESLEDVLVALARVIEDDAERLGVLRGLVEVQDRILDRSESAIDTYRQILGIAEDDEPSVRALVRLYRAQKNWYELIEAYQRLSGMVSGEELDEVEYQMAEVMLGELQQPFDALERLAGVAERNPTWAAPFDMMRGMLDDEGAREEVYRRLSQIHAQHQQWAPLAALCSKRLTYLDDPFERSGTYAQLAEVLEVHMDAPERALETYGRAYKEVPDGEEMRAEMERLAASQGAWQALANVYEAALEQGIGDPTARMVALRRLGELYVDRLEDAERSVTYMEQVLELDEYDQSALDVLDMLYERAERWDDLADVLSRKLTVVEPEQLNDVRFRLGELREVRFAQHIDAFDLYRQVLLDDPTHRGTTEALERLVEDEALRFDVVDLLESTYQQNEAWAKLVQLYQIRLNTADAPHERADLYLQMADLELERLERVEQGFTHIGQAFTEDPFNQGTQERYEALAAAHGMWPALVDRYEAIVADLDDPIRVMEIAMVGGRAAMGELGDPARSFDFYSKVLDIEPTHEEALVAMESLARNSDDRATLAKVLKRKADLINDPVERFATLGELGGVYTELDQFDDAIDAFRDAWLIDEQNTEVMEALMQLYEHTGKWEEYVEVTERMVGATGEPEAQYGYLMRAGQVSADELEQPERAIGFYERASFMFPDDPKVLGVLEPLYESAEQFDKLDDNLARQLEGATESGEQVRLLVRRAQVLHQHFDRSADAIGLFSQAEQLEPTSELIVSSLDELYRKEEQWPELFTLYHRQLEIVDDPARRADLSVEMANISATQLGDAGTAMQYLEFALQLDAAHLGALSVLESLHARAGDYDSVVKTMGRRLQAVGDDVPGQVEILIQRAEVHVEHRGDVGSAASDYFSVLDREPEHAGAYEALRALLESNESWDKLYKLYGFRVERLEDADRKPVYVQMAELAARTGDVPKRIDALESAYRYDDADLDVVEPLLDAYIAGAMFESAEPLLESTIETLTNKRRMKDVVRFYHLRGKLAERQGDDAAALEAYEAARRHDATYVPNLLSLGKLLFASNPDDALKIFQTLLLNQMNIKDPADKVDMFYHLGMIRMQNGDARRAKDMFNRALGVDPNHEPSKQALGSL